jgi:hypothetical protein
MRAKRLLEEGPPCPRCGGATAIFEHVRITKKQLQQPYYYRCWYKCEYRGCKTTLIMPEDQKVWNSRPDAVLNPGDDIVMDILSE